MVESVNVLVDLWSAGKDVYLGAIGGAVVYLFDYSKASRNKDVEFVFRFSSLIINMALGMFVAYAVGSVLPHVLEEYRDMIMLFSGFTAYNILVLTESRFASILFDRLERIFGSSDNTKP